MHFVYRSHYEGTLSKRVVRLPDDSVLGWFRRGWRVADPEGRVETELDGYVYGLSSIFEAANEEQLPLPETTEHLRELFHERLAAENSPTDNRDP